MAPRGKKGKRKQKVARQLSLGPYMPNRCIGRHKYTQVVGLSESYTESDIDASSLNVFQCGGMYDVDESGVGHQPRFFDEMCTFYSKYRVLGSRITVKFINLCGEPAYCILHRGSQNLSAGWTAQHARELKGCQTRILHSLDSGPKSVVILRSGYSPMKAMNKSKTLCLADNDLVGDATKNPDNQWHWTIAVQQVSATLGGSDPLTVQCEVTVDYTTEWFDRKVLTQPS